MCVCNAGIQAIAILKGSLEEFPGFLEELEHLVELNSTHLRVPNNSILNNFEFSG